MKSKWRNRMCQLCGETEEESKKRVEMYVGGCIGFAHEDCLEIAEKGISLYEKWVLFTMKILPEYQRKQQQKSPASSQSSPDDDFKTKEGEK